MSIEDDLKSFQPAPIRKKKEVTVKGRNNPISKILLGKREIEQIELLAGYGLRTDDIARVIGLSPRKFQKEMNENHLVDEAVRKGRAIAKVEVTKTAYNLATSGKHPSMTMFWLKCRDDWIDQPKQDKGANEILFITRVGDRGEILHSQIEGTNHDDSDEK